MLLDHARKLRCWLVMAVLAGLIFVSGPRAERWGDNFQIGLPLLALGCQIAQGKAPELLLRYAVLFAGIHTPKAALGDAPLNRRPSGSPGGMPSGHTATAVFGASALLHDCVRHNLFVRAGIVLAAAFTGASRIEADAHSIWQVLLGAIWGLICDRALRRPSWARSAATRGLARVGDRLAVPTRRLADRLRAQFRARRPGLRGRMAGLHRRMAGLRRRTTRLRVALAATATMLLAALPLRAETTIGLYGGYQTAPHSDVTIDGHEVRAGWKGKSFEMPPYWGVRLTRWQGDWGWGAEFTHAKIYADDRTMERAGLTHLEFTDGLNLVTVNALRRWPRARVTPYVGAGLGVAVPHVEVDDDNDPNFDSTHDYQLTGPAMRAFAGVSWPLGRRWEATVEYQFTYSSHAADLDSGGTLETDIITNAVNIGLALRF
ncbi:outer membrane beta-barrel protein [Paracoccus sp. S3-43]|uniref:phosphatase PAP2 family protein n=1 Tax=Paracoccus sp. S3-43 TaxID=3030011 RepID=UPI0023B0510D|nr:outer membrane beta-barrel protein [Paracoccus sp. S3-43]WEF24407.1 outer membrane beta-barrel protein [Paracoccus sp. S3-43]